MSIVFSCSGCNVRLTLHDDSAGTAMQCPKCAANLRVPGVVSSAARTAPLPKREPAPEPRRRPLSDRRVVVGVLALVAVLLLVIVIVDPFTNRTPTDTAKQDEPTTPTVAAPVNTPAQPVPEVPKVAKSDVPFMKLDGGNVAEKPKPDPLQPGTKWKGWITQRGKAPVAVLPENWDAELTILSRNQEYIEIETRTSCKEGFKGYGKGRARLTVNWAQGDTVSYEISDEKAHESRLEGPNARTWPTTSRSKITGNKWSGTWESKIPADGVDLRGEFEYTRVE